MPATVRITLFSGGGPTKTDATTSGLKFSWGGDNVGTTPMTLPYLSGVGTTYSWYKPTGLEATAIATPATTILNRKISISSSEPSGMGVFWLATGTYVQSTSGNRPANTVSGSIGPPTPPGYTRATTTPAMYDSSSIVTVANVINGQYVQLCVGADSTFTSGAGTYSLPDIIFTYDEY